jgi:drug/metabolite transporter (DMT)-like permease
MDRRLQGSFMVLGSAICYGLLPIFTRYAYADGAAVMDLLFVRFATAFLTMGAFLGLQGRIEIPPKKTLLVLLGLGGIGYFLSSTCYFSALLYLPISVVVLVLYTYPAFVTGLSFALGFEGISRRVMAALLMALAGLALVANPVLNLSAIGVAFALGAAVTYTAYILVSSRTLNKTEGEISSFFVFGGTAVSFGALLAATGGFAVTWNADGWLWVLLISIVSTSMAMTLFFKGLNKVGPSRASILSIAELVTSVLAAFVIFGETLTTVQMAGGLLILAAAVLTALSGDRNEPTSMLAEAQKQRCNHCGILRAKDGQTINTCCHCIFPTDTQRRRCQLIHRSCFRGS